MRSMVEGATTGAVLAVAPSTGFAGLPPPQKRVRTRPALARSPSNLSRTAAALGLFLLSACSTGSRQPVTPVSVDAGRTAGLVTAYRAENGLPPVGVDPRLTQAAIAQARAMGERDRIGHRVAGPLPRRVSATGYDWGAAAENLGAGYPSLEAAMRGWKDSGEHRRNLLNPRVSEIGVAAVATPPGSKHRTYWALILAGPRRQPSPAGPFGMAAP
jgi:uncharacterized protein YkwD